MVPHSNDCFPRQLRTHIYIGNMYPSPVIGGFNPDPSIVRVGGDYYLVTSTFEYLPGIPVYHSTDLQSWVQIGNVVTRPEQANLAETKTPGGAWAPVIRFHQGSYYVAVTFMFDQRTVIYKSENPAGPWSDGLEVGVKGIDPDLAWDDNGDCYITFSGLALNDDLSGHAAITQVKVDLVTGELLEPVRGLWEGSGGMFPEGPHLYKIEDYWYLLAAEGGTDRGHLASVARSRNIRGPFEASPNNPVLTARSTNSTIQNKGHADLVQLADGSWAMVFLGVRPRGMSKAFSPLGRETFMSPVDWHDGWPIAHNIDADEPAKAAEFRDTFESAALGRHWLGVRKLPSEFTQHQNSSVVVIGSGQSMSSLSPDFLCKRQQRLLGTFTATVQVTGTGGISIRYNEDAHYDLEVCGNEILARFKVVGLESETPKQAVEGVTKNQPIKLYARFYQPPFAFTSTTISCDQIELGYLTDAGAAVAVATYDGRYLSSEVNSSFTGRAVGVYSQTGSVAVFEMSETN